MLSITRRRRATAMVIHRRATVTVTDTELGTDARRVTPCRAATVRRTRVLAAADGVLGTPVPLATRCKAVTVRRIEATSPLIIAADTAPVRAVSLCRRRATKQRDELAPPHYPLAELIGSSQKTGGAQICHQPTGA